MFAKMRIVLWVALVIASGVLLLWSILPSRLAVETHVLKTEALRVVVGDVKSWVIPGGYQVRLETPRSMRIGDPTEIHLGLQESPGVVVPRTLEPGEFDVYDSASVMAEARLEVAGLAVEPGNPVRQSLPQGESVEFTWQVNPLQAGTHSGNIWLSLRVLPLDGYPAFQVPVYVGEVSLPVTSLLGLSAPQARLVGVVGVILGLALLINVMIKRNRKARINTPESSLENQMESL